MLNVLAWCTWSVYALLLSRTVELADYGLVVGEVLGRCCMFGQLVRLTNLGPLSLFFVRSGLPSKTCESMIRFVCSHCQCDPEVAFEDYPPKLACIWLADRVSCSWRDAAERLMKSFSICSVSETSHIGCSCWNEWIKRQCVLCHLLKYLLISSSHSPSLDIWY